MKVMNHTEEQQTENKTSLSNGAKRNRIFIYIAIAGVIAAVITAAFTGYYLHQERAEEKKQEELLKAEKAKRQKEKEDDEDSVLSLPLVLDAPFSKLGTQNIGLISKQLPEFAEQVIIFMLDKDWEASGLEQNTLPEYCYRVEREYSDISSTIANNGGAL